MYLWDVILTESTRLFDAGIKLTKEGKRTILNPFKFSDYRSRAQEFENVTEGLRDEVTVSGARPP